MWNHRGHVVTVIQLHNYIVWKTLLKGKLLGYGLSQTITQQTAESANASKVQVVLQHLFKKLSTDFFFFFWFCRKCVFKAWIRAEADTKRQGWDLAYNKKDKLNKILLISGIK